MEPNEIPRDIINLIMMHWGGHKIGLTYRYWQSRLRPSNYLIKSAIPFCNSVLTVASKLPNGIFHGPTTVKSPTALLYAFEYDLGNLICAEKWAGGSLKQRDELIDGAACRWDTVMAYCDFDPATTVDTPGHVCFLTFNDKFISNDGRVRVEKPADADDVRVRSDPEFLADWVRLRKGPHKQSSIITLDVTCSLYGIELPHVKPERGYSP